MLREIQHYFQLAQTQGGLAWLQPVLLLTVLLYFLVNCVRLWRIDMREHRLPDRIVLPMYAAIGLPLWLVLLIDEDILRMRNTAYATIFLGGIYWLLRKLSRNSIGFGDVKLAGVIGMMCGFFSPLNILWATFLAFITGGLFAVALVVARRASAKSHIAFGPFMILGAVIAVFFPA